MLDAVALFMVSCLVDGILPCWFETTASSIVKKIYEKIVRKK